MGVSNSVSHASLSNPASSFMRQSEQLCILLQIWVWATTHPDWDVHVLHLTRVWATPCSDWDVRVYNKQREVRVQCDTRISII